MLTGRLSLDFVLARTGCDVRSRLFGDTGDEAPFSDWRGDAGMGLEMAGGKGAGRSGVSTGACFSLILRRPCMLEY